MRAGKLLSYFLLCQLDAIWFKLAKIYSFNSVKLFFCSIQDLKFGSCEQLHNKNVDVLSAKGCAICPGIFTNHLFFSNPNT